MRMENRSSSFHPIGWSSSKRYTLKGLEGGYYRVVLEVTDKVSGQPNSSEEDFTATTDEGAG